MNGATVAAVSASDRLGFTLFLAIALHAAGILGIGFSLSEKQPPAQTIEVTLAHYQSEEAPKEADFLAQADQLGSGQSDEKLIPTTREKADFQHRDIQETAPLQPQAPPQLTTPKPAQPQPEAPTPELSENAEQSESKPTAQVISTSAQNKPQTNEKPAPRKKSTAPAPAPGSSTSLLARSLEIASLEAQLELQRQEYAKRPRVKRLTSASTRSHSDAVYLDNWRKKIEATGNLNYPEQARRQQLYGSLRLMVSVLPDGSVKEIRILHSSGNKVLDDAAVRIVQMASPFQQFPIEMRKNTDILEIIRTWKFEKSTRLY
ncbi:TonB family protein [Amphritea sp. HPY]|uniref:energy transducer TonB n=1 Tax=Amphritea sp. HPY TaxID=3421652 RepID=UPI003D7C8300